MTSRAVTPNRRGLKSRELVLDAAEQVMAEDGFDAATVARVVEVSGIPMSSVYHYFRSKDGILLAVMERGNTRFLADIPDPDERVGDALGHLTGIVTSTVAALERHPPFLRLLIVFAIQPPRSDAGEVDAVVGRVRDLARSRLRKHLALAFDDDPRSARIQELARFALAAFDGAFVAWQADRGARLADLLRHLPPALVGAWDAAAHDG